MQTHTLQTTPESASLALPTTPEAQELPDSETISRVAGSVHQAVDRVAQKADGALQSLRGSTEGLRETGDQSLAHVQDYVREKPLMALGIAAVAGFLLSRLIR